MARRPNPPQRQSASSTATHAALQQLRRKISELSRLAETGVISTPVAGGLRDPVGHYDIPHSDTSPGHFDVGHWDANHGDRVHLDGYGDTAHDDGEHDDRGHDDGGHDDGEHDDGGHDDGHDDGGHDDGHDDGGHDDGGHDDGGHDDGGHDDGGHDDDSDFWSRLNWLISEMEVVLTALEKSIFETVEQRQARAFTETHKAIAALTERVTALEGARKRKKS